MIKNGVTRRPLFWALFAGISLVCILFSIKYFSQALPIAHINLTMNRQAALTQASIITKKYRLGPQTFQQAASFETDNDTQFFVELEAGGKKVFHDMMHKKLYEPYTWKIRQFHEAEHNEVTMLFTPNGTPYGFNETISETIAGAQLTTSKAQTLAEQFATLKWSLDLHPYKLIESAQEKRKSGRIDHTFVYERTDHQIGVGRYRLKLVVSGDKVTGLSHFVKIPDDFKRRYQEMRAANKSLATTSGILALLLYILGGGLLGLFFLAKSGSLIWRMPLICAGILSTLQFAAGINNIPSAWMTYDTALSSQNFLILYLLQTFILALAFCALMTVAFATAEGLTRKAFGTHPQLWKLWLQDVGSSTTVLGRTVAGYLMVGIQMALVVTIYLFANRFFNWWWPSDLLIDPNILSTRLPWLSSISNALNAGFLEECLFRAVPLSCAALLGNHFGKRAWWIGGAFIVQALIFGGAHADYPAQPAYARLLELIIPSFMFGGMYLRYGLLPAIITHSVFDLALMSLPLFVTSASGMLFNQFFVILAALIPLLAVLNARLRTGKFTTLAASYYNAAWQPETAVLNTQDDHLHHEVPYRSTQKITKKIFLILGLLGGISWIALTRFHQNAPRLDLNQTQAIQLARRELIKKNIILSDEWKALAITADDQSTTNQHKFVWQADKSLYKKLIGSYLVPPLWIVRFVNFDRTVEQKSEEYRVFISKTGTILRFEHQLPETLAGAQLSEEQARSIANKQVLELCDVQSEQLKFISTQADKKPNRMNWTFTFSNPLVYTLKEGEARIALYVSGDTVTNTVQGIYVPEQWERDDRKQLNIMMLIKIICLLMLFTGFIFVIVKNKTLSFSPAVAFFSFILLLLYTLFSSYNMWPAFMSQFNTSEPLGHQFFMLLISLGVGSLIRSLILAFMFGLVFTRHVTEKLHNKPASFIAGISLGLLALGVISIINLMLSSFYPIWASYEALRFQSLFVGTALAHIFSYTILVAFALLVLKSVIKTERQWQLTTTTLFIMSICVGIAIAGVQSFPTIFLWILAGLIEGIMLFFAYYFVLRADYKAIVPMLATFMVGLLIQQAAFNAYPWSMASHGIAALCIMLTCMALFKRTA